MNKFLRSYREFYKCYIDNIVIFSRNIVKHLTHLDIIFALFSQIRIFLKSRKSYVEYLFVTLLEQRVNNLDLWTFEEKFVA